MITLVLGGARSGKSEVGERLAAAAGAAVHYVATAGPGEGMDERIAEHRRRRPDTWTTVEVIPGGDLGAVLEALHGVVLVDSLGTWLAGLAGFVCDGEALAASLRSRDGDTVVVSDEVGMGVHPSSSAGMEFRDALGSLNRWVADVADRAVLVVAGRVVELARP